jgi:hypothetical protein
MGRFYFHQRAGHRLIPDVEGLDLPDVSAARREAILSAREILAAAIRTGQAKVPDAFVISDEAGRALDAVPLAEVLPEALKEVGTMRSEETAMQTVEQCQAYADEYKLLATAGRISIRRATILMGISRSWRVLANQLDRLSEIEKDEGEAA